MQQEYGKATVKKRRRPLDNSAFILSADDLRKLFAAARRLQDTVLLELMAYSGLRRDECVWLATRDVDADRGVLHLRKTKGLRARDVPLLPQVARDVRHLTEGRHEGYVLLNPQGQRLTPQAVNYTVAELGKRAGLVHPADANKGLNPHLLRHTFARRYLREGGSIVSLQKILGHSSITTTVAIYGSPSMDAVKADYDKAVKAV